MSSLFLNSLLRMKGLEAFAVEWRRRVEGGWRWGWEGVGGGVGVGKERVLLTASNHDDENTKNRFEHYHRETGLYSLQAPAVQSPISTLHRLTTAAQSQPDPVFQRPPVSPVTTHESTFQCPMPSSRLPGCLTNWIWGSGFCVSVWGKRVVW